MSNKSATGSSARARADGLSLARISAGFPNIVRGMRIGPTKTLAVVDPVTGEVLASVCDMDRDGLDGAVQAAQEAFPAWAAQSWNERASLLAEMMANISNHFDELVAILIAEGGRPRATAEWEIKWVLDQYVPSLLSRTLPDQSWDEAGIGKITKRHMPLGVVAAISPWNLPFLLSFVKILPALLTGNTVVLKPSPFTPLTVLRAADLMHTILPKGVLNVITGGDSLGPWLTTHPDIAKVSFTGSTQTGRRVFASSAETLKHITLELGGNDPGIVLADADPAQIANPLFWSMFMLNGQACLGMKRLLVHENIYEPLTQALVAIATQQSLGDGFDPNISFGPIQNRSQLQRLERHWLQIEQDSTRLLYRGTSPTSSGLFFPITILDNPPPTKDYVREEIFGPLRSVLKYSSIDEAVRIANDTPYGLGASVWGSDPAELDAVARRIDAGTVWINQHLNTNPNVPLAGHKSSGIGVQFGDEGLKEFCNIQVIAARQ